MAPKQRVRTGVVLLLLASLALLTGCQRDDGPPAEVAASNTLLQSAVADLLGRQTPVLCLADPGMCPGHFDVRPSQIQQLRHSRLLLRLDFQKKLDEKLAGPIADGLRVVEIQIPGGLCEPDSYLAACRQTADALVEAGLLDRAAADTRLVEIEKRVRQTEQQCRQKIAPLKDRPVVASAHQKAFCQWLGLRPVATFTGADTASVGQIADAIDAGEKANITIIIANRPEGRRLADALAERLKANVVVFDNFPTPGGEAPFDELLTANVDALVKAAGR